MDVVSQIILLIFLILLNAFFVASEFVLIALRKTQVEELVKKGSPFARYLLIAVDHLDNYISATQLGVTMVSLILGVVGEMTVAQKLAGLFSFMPTGPAAVFTHAVSFIIAFLLITYLQIVIGELVPKAIALQKTEFTALIVIAPLTLFAKIFSPFIKILNKSARFVLLAIRLHPTSSHQLNYSIDEIKMILDEFRQSGILPKGEVEMAQNVFKLQDIPTKQIMIPRTDIVAYEETTTFKSVLKHTNSNGFSRFPVYSRTIDNIVGFIHIKDVYRAILANEGDKRLSKSSKIRKILVVPENKKADEVLLDMRRKHIHLAVVDDEYGGTAGIVSLEDIIESLVGEIQDEFDKPIKEIRREIDGSFLIDGRASLEAVQKRFPIPVKGLGYSSIGGLVFGLLGREPRVGDKVQLSNITFTVEEIEGKRVRTIRLRRETMK